MRFFRALAFLVIFLSPISAGQQTVVPVPFMMKSNNDWWHGQYGRSAQDWSRALGADFRNRNSGPACVLMLVQYKKRTGIALDYGSFSDLRYPRVHSEARWKFCRDNPDKRYPGGFAADDGAEASGEEMAALLSNEDMPAILISDKDQVTTARIGLAIGRNCLAVCRVDPSAYFRDEARGSGRWVVVFALDDTGATIHDPGRPEGKGLRLPLAVLNAALRGADGGRGATLIECIMAIGNHGDGWHADGRSAAFMNGYRKYQDRIGRPANPGATFNVHHVGTCVVQDFQQDLDKPHFGSSGASLLFLDSSWLRVFLVKGEFLDTYMSIWGFDRLESPTSGEYQTANGLRQDFEKGHLLSDGKRARVVYGF